MTSIPGPKALNVAQHLLRLRSNPICAGAGDLRGGRLVWEYRSQPTPVSREYDVRIVYQVGHSPEVYVINPDLVQLAGGRRLPHVYQQRPARLCLYLPRTGEWHRRLRLDQSIVPWTALWLFYFEDWLTTDDWKGGGVHPRQCDLPRRAALSRR